MATLGKPVPEPPPTSQSVLLRLKHHKTTILLHVNPTQTFDSIKRLLLDALAATKYTHINGGFIPSSTDWIEFGVPRNNNDLSEGFVPLEIKDGKGKGKGRGEMSVLNGSPKGAGLKDGQAVAFRFRDPGKEKDGGNEDEEIDVEEEMEEKEWDVVVPSFEYEENMMMEEGEKG